MGRLTVPLKVKFNSEDKSCHFELARAISHHRLKLGFLNLDPKCPYWFRDWLSLIFSFISNCKPFFTKTLRLLFICIVLCIFRETIASECSTSPMAPHVCWSLFTRTGSCYGPWNSLVLYLGETIEVQPTPTRRLALEFTSCYHFSP